MGNIDAPFGLRPVGHVGGADWNGITERCYIHADYATALYVGDPVAITATTGYRDTTGKHMSIVKATAGDTYQTYGVIVSFEPNASTQAVYNPASTQRYANVCTDPSVVYDIRDNGSGTPTKDMVGANAVFIFTHNGSTYTGLSGVELDMSSDVPAADSSNQMLILGVAPYEDNTLGDFAIWRVILSNHTLKATADTPVGNLGVIAS